MAPLSGWRPTVQHRRLWLHPEGPPLAPLACDLLEQFQPFPAQAIFILDKARGVAARRARLSTKPAPTGSATAVNIIGTVRVACINGPTCEVSLAKMTSGASATNSAAYLRVRSASPKAPKRYSIRKLRPSLQPNSSSRCRNAASQTCTSGLSAAPDWSTPMRRIRSACCARAASGHVAAAPPSSVMKARRLFIRSPRRRGRASYPAR